MKEFRRLQIKLTPQRLAILNFLRGNKSHPSAEDIYKAVLKHYPTMSFATVYNTLEALKNKQRVKELKIDSGKKRYDPDTTKHHHILCIKCKKILDLHTDFKLDVPEELTHGFELLGNSIEFYGLCRKCRKRH
ncbi:MAG: transcriptional repressor [Deferribacteres bacterium]|nr:transcriptional repressor [Deferribacteres bacterium]